jgi:outer membrane protein insertion porin family
MFKLAALVSVAMPVTAVYAQALLPADSTAFVVSSIRVEGLQRVSEGTLFNYLPVNVGDTLSPQRVRESMRALFGTGLFRDIQMRRDGGTLIVVVLERPSIASFEINGNKDIKTEDLQKSLRGVGLATGKTFDHSVLADVQQYLTEQYFSRGKYGARINTVVEDLPSNQVKIKIDIREGKRARIRQINVVGNERFTDEEIEANFELKTPNWLSWYKQDDRYSRESLQGDLEKLRSFYMDRGYANFRIDSQQIAISPEKDDIFITLNVDEGKVYKLSDVKLAGTFPVAESELRRLLLVAPGQTFSQKAIAATQQLIQNRLGEDGFAFAKVDPVPTTNDKTQEISLTFFVDPANRVYVRNITFSGSEKIDDEVLRREMRQLEGGWLSNVAVERSKQRIQRLPYVKDVSYETVPVPGSADLVDVNFNVKEGPSAQLGGGIGYSESQHMILNGTFADANFLGGGERVALELNTSSYRKTYSLSHTNPYMTMDGVSRTVNLAYTDTQQLTSNYSNFSTKTSLAGVDIGYPVSEQQSVRFGASLQHQELATLLSSSTQIQDWVRSIGNSKFRPAGLDYILSTAFDTVELSAGWGFDSRNRTIFPTKGALHRFQVSSAAPGMPVEYATATYQYQQFFHVLLPFMFDAHVSYATAFGSTSDVPPYRHFFTGGPDSVRGFSEYTLGPRDSLGNPYGGDAAVSGQLEALLPMPAKFAESARASVFFDFGQSFYLGNTQFTDKVGFPADYKPSLDALRTSVGLGVQWLAPLGLFRFSFAYPLHYQRETWRRYGDDVERFQFSIGNAF